jgi:D-amino-acid dehydrogenase
LQFDPAFYAWGLRFLWNCPHRQFEANTRNLLKLAAKTEDLLPEVIREFDLRFDYAPSGKRVLCHSRQDYQKAAAGVAFKTRLGLDQYLLTRDEAEKIEPALRHNWNDFAGAVFSHNDAVGRVPEFCIGLLHGLQQRYGLTLMTGTTVQRLLVRKGRVAGLIFSYGDAMSFEAVVVATGHIEALLPVRARAFGGM